MSRLTAAGQGDGDLRAAAAALKWTIMSRGISLVRMPPRGPSKPEHVDVRALIERGEREMLILKPRAVDDDCPWEFPGGRAERRESPEAALRRIFRALFQAELELLQGQPPFVHNFGDHSVTYRYYICGIRIPNVAAPAGSELRWVRVGQLRDYHFDAPTQQVVDWLLEPE
ncbi:MAG: NUDIX domain-containing protein [Planctomycetes bacterium]|nr:NUDIX domain-containing protein [Planctomycetota bacterium]